MTVYDVVMNNGDPTSKTAAPEGPSGEWTIHQLCVLAEAALLRDYNGPADGRAQARPNERMLRYYATLGLLDRPSAWRARTALYGLRHLRQIVAVKRLQERGLALVTIQERLLGIEDDALATLAPLPLDVAAGGPLADAAKHAIASAPESAALLASTAPSATFESPAVRGRPEFWREEPSTSADSAAPGATELTDALVQSCADGAPDAGAGLHSHVLGPDCLLVWRGRAATPEAQEELQRVAGFLRDVLRRHGLTDAAEAARPDHQQLGDPEASPGS